MPRLLQALVVALPWRIRRLVLVGCFGYEIDATARIGIAWVFPSRLRMGPRSRIDHLTVCKGLALVELGEAATIGRGNWITGFPRGHDRHFAHQPDRSPELRLGEHAAITNRHLIDCTNRVEIGAYTTIAGFRSQILTHSIDLGPPRQSSSPVRIGRFCFVGTGCTVLGGSVLPDHSALAAMSLLNREFSASHRLYGGVPARDLAPLDPGLGYFTRSTGFIY